MTVRRVIFTASGFLVEYEDLSREERVLVDRSSFSFRGLTGAAQLAGHEFWTLAGYELELLFRWSRHVRRLSNY